MGLSRKRNRGSGWHGDSARHREAALKGHHGKFKAGIIKRTKVVKTESEKVLDILNLNKYEIRKAKRKARETLISEGKSLTSQLIVNASVGILINWGILPIMYQRIAERILLRSSVFRGY